ncbi:unnamed protein product [Candidula unifasciata]|uniref:LEM domain-containing protein n=1 Tax=Candidula unifasciata TaxID=100452 RepID=A0A8S3YJG0_9EUPU|nr:unnamed protein product [Candidula unifasciata]
MADEEMTDAELVAELRQYGEEIPLPLKPNKRQILLKKLNHLKARSITQNSKQSVKTPSANYSRTARSSQSQLNNRGDGHTASSYTHSESSNANSNRTAAAASPQLNDSRSRRYSNNLERTQALNGDKHNLEDSDGEHVANSPNSSYLSSLTRSSNSKNHVHGQNTSTNHVNSIARENQERKRSSQLSDSVFRTLRRRTVEPPPQRRPQRSSVLEVSTEKSRLSRSFNESSDGEIAVPSPARSKLYSGANNVNPLLSRQDDNRFESSDSDFDEGTTVLVENKRLRNSSFPSVHHSGRHDSSHTEYLSSNKSSSYLNSSNTTHHPRLYPWRRNYLNGHHRVQQYRSWYLEILPQVLIGVAALFFISLSVTYIVIHKDFFFSWFSSSSNIGTGDHLLLCKNGMPSQDCFNKDEVDRTLKIIEKLFDELSTLKGVAQCDSSREIDPTIRTEVLLDRIKAETLSLPNAQRLHECCLRHILANPHWNIRAQTADGSSASDLKDIAKLQSEVAAMGFLCRLRRSFSTVLYGIFTVIVVLAAILLLLASIKYKLKQKEVEQKEVYAMVENIIDILQNHYEQTKGEDSSDSQYLAVQHVRDQLLPPSKRRKMQPIWDKAVKFIGANESRIRLETRLIHGDEFEVWHWIQPALHNGKIWQGQAFGENSENKGNNPVIYSPTPCLKIRNMFDSNVENEDNWEDCVTDAILEKCKTIDSIVHIFVDVDSREGCVYLKCSSCEAAGKARLSLHGWWFDGRLVTVKHLKTDHYHKRWPEARDATKPLKPSTDQMRSLSQPYYRSSLEMT